MATHNLTARELVDRIEVAAKQAPDLWATPVVVGDPNGAIAEISFEEIAYDPAEGAIVIDCDAS